MSTFGFTFKALYQLDVDELWDISRLIKGESHYLPKDKEVLIRGVIIPFLREGSKAPQKATKDQVMRAALVRVAQSLSIVCDNWETVENDWLIRRVRRHWDETFRKRLENLKDEEMYWL